MRRVVFLLVCLLLLTPVHAAAGAQGNDFELLAANEGTMLSISDLHFNPFFDKDIVSQLMKNDYKKWYSIFSHSEHKQVAGYGHQTNFKLFDSALQAMKANCPSPDFILFSGDLLAHSFKKKFQGFSTSDAAYKKFVVKTLSFISWQFQHYYPTTPVFFALGNNDAYDDYKIAPPPSDTFLSDTKGIFFYYYMKGDPTTKAAFDGTYGHGGNYSVRPASSKANRIIALNDIFFSKRNTYPNEGWRQLQWLESELASAKKNDEKVWLMLHIPPGIDVRGTLSHPEQASLYWDDAHKNAKNQTFLDKFMNLTKSYSAVIKAIFCGHTHMDHFRLVHGTDNAAIAYVHITPGVSPEFDNNPAFQVLKYDTQSFAVMDFRTLFYNYAGSAWKREYGFGQTYGRTPCNAKNAEIIYDMIGNEAGPRQNFIHFYNVNSKESPPVTQNNWKAYWCGIAWLTGPDFTTCYSPPTSGGRWNLNGAY
jgi:sphingomyelin phosphodiesterase acid-like 3